MNINDANIDYDSIEVSIIKLSSGDEIIAIVPDTHAFMSTHEDYDEDADYGFWVEYPLKIYSVIDYEHGIHASSFFTQWMPLSKDKLIGINYENIVSYATATDKIKRRYFEMIEMFNKMNEINDDDDNNIEENDFSDEEYEEYAIKNKEKSNEKKPILH